MLGIDLKAVRVDRNLLIYSLLLLIVAFAVFDSARLAIGPSNMGDDVAYAYSAHTVATGQFLENAGNILTLRLLQIIPIGAFYFLFGVTALSSAAWDITAFALSIVLVFLIGRDMYDDRVGLLAALLFSFYPLLTSYSITMSDNIPMMLFVCLSMFLLLRAMRNNSRRWYFAAGMATFAPALTTPEGFIFWLMVGVFILVELLRKKVSINKTTLLFPAGFAVAFLLLMLFNQVNIGKPLVTFTANIKYYGETWRPDLQPLPLATALAFYPSVMFPYHLIREISFGVLNPLKIVNEFTVSSNVSSFYYYAFIPAALYLALKKDRRAYAPLFWFLFGLMYLQFGPQHVGLSPFSYALSHRLDRYLMLIAAPLAIILAAAMAALVSESRGAWKYASIAVCAAFVLVLAYTSLQLLLMIHDTEFAIQYPMIQVANALSGVPTTALIYIDSGYGGIEPYMNYSNITRFKPAYGGLSNCTYVPAGSYVVIPEYPYSGQPGVMSWPSECPYWQKTFSQDLSKLTQYDLPFARTTAYDIYYVPKGHSTGS